MRKSLIVLVMVLSFVGGFVISYRILRRGPGSSVNRPASPTPLEQTEQELRRLGRRLVSLPLACPEKFAAVRYTFRRGSLAEQPLFAHKEEGREGRLKVGAATESDTLPERAVSEGAELLITADRVTLLIDGRPLPLNLHGWSFHRSVAGGAEPREIRVKKFPRYEVVDNFMREDFGTSDYWTIHDGEWRPNQHGGGVPEQDVRLESYNVQRAVNPFTVLGKGGAMSYGDASWINYHAEARFYFGVPRTGNVSDLQTVPTGTDMLVAQGPPTGRQIAFGWMGGQGTFVLAARENGGKWQVLERWDGGRPPLSNWVRVGLSIESGCIASAWLDGQRVMTRGLTTCVSGPFSIIAGAELIELDDVKAWSLPARGTPGTPAYVQSRFFSEKQRKKNSDPEQFEQWARSSSTYKRLYRMSDGKLERVTVVTQMALQGDFWYEGRSTGSGSEQPLPGTYEISMNRHSLDDSFDLDHLKPVFRLRATLAEGGWQITEIDGKARQMELNGKLLRLRCLRSEEGRVQVETRKGYVAVSEPIAGPVHFSVARLSPRRPRFPDPDHHLLRCSNRVNELFEEAPTDWSWIDGSFRMDCRWACQNLWNFMACGSPGAPALTSKRAFFGRQAHEYFMTIRPVFPNDSGHADFCYDPRKDEKMQMFRANKAWYNPRDLNFSFCTNGRDPLSGYAVIFGGHDNSVTRLLRRGVVVAETSKFQLHTHRVAGGLHWKWWRFFVRKDGARVMVDINIDDYQTRLFDYADPDPIAGGHIMFWTVRNGFIVSRVISNAQRIEWKPDVLYVHDSAATEWRPLIRDSVTISRSSAPFSTEVESETGTGFFAVRWTPPRPVDLKRTPVLELPVKLGEDVRANLHLEVGGGSYMIQLNAPLSRTKELLTPAAEAVQERFRIGDIGVAALEKSHVLGKASPEGTVRMNLMAALERIGAQIEKPLLTSITVGNSSNEGYLLAGGGANQRGARYWLGTPQFSEK